MLGGLPLVLLTNVDNLVILRVEFLDSLRLQCLIHLPYHSSLEDPPRFGFSFTVPMPNRGFSQFGSLCRM